MARSVVIVCLLSVTVSILLATSAAGITAAHWLWLDDETTYQCDDPFVSEELTCWLTATTSEDCDGGGNCSFYWSEGVIGLISGRLMVDLSYFAGVDSVEIYYWDTEPGDLRAFFYNQGTTVNEVHADGNEEMVTLRTEGNSVDQLAISACGGEFYEMAIYGNEGTSNAPLQKSIRFSSPYPNPANPRCTLAFELLQPASIQLEIFSLSGRLVRTLAQLESLDGGFHQRIWNGVNDQGQAVASGVYLVQLKVGSEIRQHPVVLVK